jgi:hypothetical protein
MLLWRAIFLKPSIKQCSMETGAKTCPLLTCQLCCQCSAAREGQRMSNPVPSHARVSECLTLSHHPDQSNPLSRMTSAQCDVGQETCAGKLFSSQQACSISNANHFCISVHSFFTAHCCSLQFRSSGGYRLNAAPLRGLLQNSAELARTVIQ